MPASYVDLILLKSWLDIGDSTTDALLQYAINTASSAIDRYTGRSFTPETAATKYFWPESPTALALTPDLRTVTSVACDNLGNLTFATALASTDWLLLPLQGFPDPGIYARMVIAPNSSRSFFPGLQVRIMGDWGYVVGGKAPDDIQQACLMLASRFIKRREAPLGVLQTTDLGQFTRLSEGDPDVLTLLKPYRSAERIGSLY